MQSGQPDGELAQLEVSLVAGSPGNAADPSVSSTGMPAAPSEIVPDQPEPPTEAQPEPEMSEPEAVAPPAKTEPEPPVMPEPPPEPESKPPDKPVPLVMQESEPEPELLSEDLRKCFDVEAARLLSQVRTIAAFAYRKSKGLPVIYPKPELKYTANFLHMMFSLPFKDYELKPEAVKALDLIFLLHADHEQNCSTATVRMVASSRANLFASAAAGVCALWGPLHGGANQAVLEMLEQIHREGDDGSKFIAAAKDKNSGRRLMGFGHRVYKHYDPRAKIIKRACDEVLDKLHINDPLLDIAKHLEEAALKDSYFVERKLYPNVDFYSGIIMRAIGIPVEMFTVMFAIGRMPGWIANYKEVMEAPTRIYRPRQIYTGPALNHYTPLKERK